MFDRIKGMIFEDTGEAQAKAPVSTSATPLGATPSAGAPHAAAVGVNDEFVQALRTALKSRTTAFTALLAAADKLASIIPDQNMRLKAGFATVSGEGRGVKEVLGAIEVHAADLESQRMQFDAAAERAKNQAVNGLQAELDTIQPSVQSAQAQIQSMTQQIQKLNEVIAGKATRAVELQSLIATENQRFTASKQQFETALTIVKSELDGQKAIIMSALS